MVLVEVVDVFSGNHVDLGVPVAVEGVELPELFPLYVGEFGEVVEDDFSCHIGLGACLEGRGV